MYLQSSWNVFRVQCQARHLPGFSKIYKSHKALPKLQLAKTANLRNQALTDKNSQLNIENEVLQISTKLATPAALQIIQKNSNGVKESKIGSLQWREMQFDITQLGQYYLKLSKFRLTSLVVMTSMIGYVMAPSPFELTSFLSCVVGTGLVSSAANSMNQFLEIPFDAQMSRTRNRVLVKGHLTPLHAVGFAATASSIGLVILYQGASTLTAALGVSNLVLYTMIYTPLKRISILNTWVGSIVGAIPPLMGWAACQGELNAGAFILGGILYAWQFPHFNALSWNLRPDYSRAGYRMMAVTNPDLCRKTALRYTLGLTACSSLAPVLNVTHWSFGVISLPINLYFIYLAFMFYRESDSKNSRKLFHFSLLHLPLLMGLMLITKEGLLSPANASNNKNINDSPVSAGQENSLQVRKKFSSPSENSSGSSFSGITLGTTLHAQVR